MSALVDVEIEKEEDNVAAKAIVGEKVGMTQVLGRPKPGNSGHGRSSQPSSRRTS